MTAEHETRARRIERGVHQELAGLLAGEVKDPGAADALVIRVRMTNDLRSARVYVRLLDKGDDSSRRKVLMAALGRASGMLRREVGQRLGLRHAPELQFEYDDGNDRVSRVEQLLAEIEAEKGPRE